MPAEAQMQKLCDLPNGQPLYYADESFTDPGFYTWDRENGENIKLSIQPASLSASSETGGAGYVEHDNAGETGEWMDGAGVNTLLRDIREALESEVRIRREAEAHYRQTGEAKAADGCATGASAIESAIEAAFSSPQQSVPDSGEGKKALTLEERKRAEAEGAATNQCPFCEGGMDALGGIHAKDCPMLTPSVEEAQPDPPGEVPGQEGPTLSRMGHKEGTGG